MSDIGNYIMRRKDDKSLFNFLAKILKDENYVIDSEDIENIESFPELLIASLENDFIETCSVLISNDKYDDVFNENLINTLSDEQVVRLNNVANEMTDVLIEIFDTQAKIRMNGVVILASGSQKFKDIIKTCDELNHSTSFLPYGFYENIDFLNEIFKNEELAEFVKREIHSNSLYTRENEVKLLKYLNSSFDTLEEYYYDIRNKKRSEMSVLEVLGIEYYGKKVLHENDVQENYMINLFKYNRSCNGEHSYYEKEICVSNGNRSVEGILKTLHHECSHAIMHRLVETGDMIKDEDVDVYCKDLILRDLLDDKYYRDNYNVISYEFDADFRALCLNSKLFGEDSVNAKIDKLYGSMMEKNIEYAKDNISYENSIIRKYDGKLYHIDDLFLEAMRNASFEKMRGIVFKYPIIGMDYDVQFDANNSIFSFREKSMGELVEQALECKLPKTREIYFKLIEKRCNPNKDRNASYNARFLLNNYHDNEELKNLLGKLANNLKEYGKYVKYKGGNKNGKVSR